MLHWPDPTVPYEESMGGLRDLVADGLALRIGISNVNVDQIRIARGILGDDLVSVENEFSLWNRDSLEALRLCEELGLAYLPNQPLGGIRPSDRVHRDAPLLRQIAHRHGASIFQVTLAWLLAFSPVMIPIPGSRRPATIQDSLLASGLVLEVEEYQALTDDYQSG